MRLTSDLISDFIPVFRYVGGVILLLAIIRLTARPLPQEVSAECTTKAEHWMASQQARQISYIGALPIFIIWITIAYFGRRWFR